jgi:hypothetical protein
MAKDESRTKWAPGEPWLSRDCTHNRRSQLAGERHILELISLGAPLPGILNKLCAAIDVRIGNVVSLISLPDDVENHVSSIAQSAIQAGLTVFSSTNILSRDRTLLGKLEIYCCDPRRPTQHESQVIERVIHLAAIALQHHEDEEDFERSSKRLRSRIGGALEGPPFIN